MIFRFLDPWFLAALLLVPAVLAAYLWIERRGRARLVFSDLSAFKKVSPSPRVRLRHALIVLRMIAVTALVIGLARPQHGNRKQEVTSKGIDIMIVLDNSSSMRQSDMEPTRLGAAKQVVKRFIDERAKGLQNDRIGLVVFSAIAFTNCPLTVDYTILDQIVGRLGFTRPEFDRTAIGTALATAVSRLDKSKAKSKVIILVTDGENNLGFDPMTAASMAKALGIKIYTIGVVPTGMMQKAMDKFFGVTFVPGRPAVDETQMENIAKTTGGKYFRATDEEALAKIFDEIDKLEKTEVKVKEFYRYTEIFSPWAIIALLALLGEAVLSRTLLRRIP